MTVRMDQQESGGFRLLEEDAMEERPCLAVKKFVASILDVKDMKDRDVASSYKNLTQYRLPNSSPSISSTGSKTLALDGDRASPSMPLTSMATNPLDNQRLPNELLDEICEDIGMKEDMELDFVEYLMEQDTNNKVYMTQAALSSSTRSTMNTPTGSTSSSTSGGSNKRLKPGLGIPATTTPNFLFQLPATDSHWSPQQHQTSMPHSTPGHPHGLQQQHSSSMLHSSSVSYFPSSHPHGLQQHATPMPYPSTSHSHELQQQQTSMLYSSSNHSQGLTTNRIFENKNKPNECELNYMGQGPTKEQGETQSNPNQLPNYSSSSCISQHYFKRPHMTAGAPKRNCLSSQDVTSATHPTNSASSGQSSNSVSCSVPSRLQKCAMNNSSSRDTCNSSDQEDRASSPNGRKKCQSVSPKLQLTSAQCGDFDQKLISPSLSQNSGQLRSCSSLPQGRNDNVFMEEDRSQPTAQRQQPQNLQEDHTHSEPHLEKWATSTFNQVNERSNFNKGIYSGCSSVVQHKHVTQNLAMPLGNLVYMSASPDNHKLAAAGSVDSPLDQGYFSNESAGNCSNGSAPSPAFTSSSISTVLPADHSQKLHMSTGSVVDSCYLQVQKSVHFADMPYNCTSDYPQNYNIAGKLPGEGADCVFEKDTHGLPASLSMTHVDHRTNANVTPYIVRGNQVHIMGGYDCNVNNRRTCSIERSSPAECNSSTSHSNSFYIEPNHDVKRMNSLHAYPSAPPPLISIHSGHYEKVHEPTPYSVNHFPSMQQQAYQSKQISHKSNEVPISSLHYHPHLRPAQNSYYHHVQPQKLSVLDYSNSTHETSSNLDMSRMSNHSFGSGGYHVPFSQSSEMPSHARPDSHAPGADQMYTLVCESSSEPNVFSSQHPVSPSPSNQAHMGVQQAPPFIWGSETNTDPSIGPMKCDLRTHQPQYNSQRPSSPKQSFIAPMNTDIQEPYVTSSVHGNFNYGDTNSNIEPINQRFEHGSSSGVTYPGYKMSLPQTNPHFQPCPDMYPVKQSYPGHQSAIDLSNNMGSCAEPGYPNSQIPANNRPQMLSSRHTFIQHLIMDEANFAYRSHPLFPLLRDLVIADMNFNNPRFHYQQLLSLLPNDFEKLLHNFLHRNPPSGHYQSNEALESVIMDSLKLAHSNLIEKIRHRQEMEKVKTNPAVSIRSIEEFCQKFDNSAIRPTENYSHHGMGNIYLTVKDNSDVFVESSMMAMGQPGNKAESKKHPSLPKEAVATMMEWLRGHKDNPYPNDDEKAMLIKQTGLSINQINYWFTNARRRILPKWAQCKT